MIASLNRLANTVEDFRIAFDKRFNDAIIQRLASNEELTYKVLDSQSMREDVIAAYLPLIYRLARVAHQEHCPIGDLISGPEDADLVEKSTFRWDHARSEVSKTIETATPETVAAFLNSREGGTLLIRVADNDEPLGLELDFAILRKEGRTTPTSSSSPSTRRS